MKEVAGATLENVFQAITQYGVIPEEEWPYNLYPAVNEAQISAERLSEFSPSREFSETNFHMLYTPNNVEEYKSILRGDNGNKPMPIVVGCAMFQPLNIENDWLGMPLLSANPAGGHAMLIYGFNNTSDVPGGGFFLAQNSWGEQWGHGNSGLLKIPYAYIQNFAMNAGTILEKVEIHQSEKELKMTETCSLGKEEADVLNSILVQELNTACKFAKEFEVALEDNILNCVEKVCPNAKESFWKTVLGKWDRFKTSSRKNFDNNLWLSHLRENNFIPDLEAYPPYMQNLFADANIFHAYELTSTKSTFYVLIFFISPVDIKNNKVQSSNIAIYNQIKTFVQEVWKRRAGVAMDANIYFSFASAKGWDCDIIHEKECFCTPPAKNKSLWNVKHQDSNSLNMTELEFLYQLYPQSFVKISGSIQKYIHLENNERNITVDQISAALNIDTRFIEKCCDKFQWKGSHINYITKDGKKAVRERNTGEALPFRQIFHSQLTTYEKLAKNMNIILLLRLIGILCSFVIWGDYLLIKLNKLAKWNWDPGKDSQLVQFYQNWATELAVSGLIVLGINILVVLIGFFMTRKKIKILFY